MRLCYQIKKTLRYVNSVLMRLRDIYDELCCDICTGKFLFCFLLLFLCCFVFASLASARLFQATLSWTWLQLVPKLNCE